jgi:hypothetical protein
VLVSTLPMLQAVLITPILAIVHNSYGEQPSANFLLRVIVAAPALTIVILLPFIGRLALIVSSVVIFSSLVSPSMHFAVWSFMPGLSLNAYLSVDYFLAARSHA